MNKKVLLLGMVTIIATAVASHRSQSSAKKVWVAFRLDDKVTNIMALSLDDLMHKIVSSYSYRLECCGKAVTPESFDTLNDECIDVLPADWRTIHVMISNWYTNHMGEKSLNSLGGGVVWANSVQTLKEKIAQLFSSNSKIVSIIKTGDIYCNKELLADENWKIVDSCKWVEIVEKQ